MGVAPSKRRFRRDNTQLFNPNDVTEAEDSALIGPVFAGHAEKSMFFRAGHEKSVVKWHGGDSDDCAHAEQANMLFVQMASFLGPGNATGPSGAVERQHGRHHSWLWHSDSSEYFAVFRPTSQVAIDLMTQGVAVGKGLNVKGKSAKNGHLSGYVPFLQIHQEEHKGKIEPAPKGARIRVFFKSAGAFAKALRAIEEMQQEQASASRSSTGGSSKSLRSRSAQTRVVPITRYEKEGLHGVELPEGLFWQVFVKRRPIEQEAGWETGRASEPAFMELNLHA